MSLLVDLLLVAIELNTLNQSKLITTRSTLWVTYYSITGGSRMAGSTLSGGRAIMPSRTLGCQSLTYLEPGGSFGNIDKSINLPDLQFYFLLLNLQAYLL